MLFLEWHTCLQKCLISLKTNISTQDLRSWQTLTGNKFLNDPELSAAIKDPSRVFIQDETALSPGVEHKKVLAPVGYKDSVYVRGGDSRLHITASVVVSADGEYVSVRLVYPGVRPRTAKLRDLPEDGITGKWKTSVAKSGYVTRDTFLEILGDLVAHVEEKNIPLPVILFIDGYAGHLGPDIFKYCRRHRIKLWLLKPNMTHVTQPLVRLILNIPYRTYRVSQKMHLKDLKFFTLREALRKKTAKFMTTC